MTEWFARPVLHVRDVAASLRFYMDRLGFTNPWRHEEDGVGGSRESGQTRCSTANYACCGGAEVDVVVIDDDLSPEERTALHASLDRALDDSEAGRAVDAAEYQIRRDFG